jgi:hypothetical protein
MKQLNTCLGVCLLGLVLVVGVQGQQREGGGELPVKVRRPVAAEPEAPGEDGGTSTLGTAPELSVFSVIKFGGVLKDHLGQPRTGITGVTFALYREQEGGAPLWLETQNVRPDAQGRYTVLLGAMQAEGLPLELFSSGEARWLGMEVQGEAEQARILLVSVPYALKAAEAETLGGRSVSEFLLAEEWEEEVRRQVEEQVEKEVETRQEELEPKQITEGASTFTASNATQVVLVTQQGSGKGLVAQSPGSGALVGKSTKATGSVFGVKGRAASTSGRGVVGLATAPTGASRGVLGETRSTSGTGVLGLATATAGATKGVRGVVKSAEGTAGMFVNQAGGKILSGKGSGGTEVFSVDGSGNFTLNGSSGGLIVQQNATSPNLIGGFSGNSVTSGVVGASIGGGGESGFSTNRVTDDFGTVGGGGNNQAGDNAGTTSNSRFATVGGGEGNTASGLLATVGGGASNEASVEFATVGGGVNNEASNFAATVPGGSGNTAQGFLSFAAGRRAKALHIGTFVWGDSTLADVSSTAANQFIARASGGVWFYSNSTLTTGVNLPAGGGSWSSLSDRNAKENFAEVDGQALLARLNAIPLLTWNYKAQDASIRHLGPMAQDFQAAFELGSDDKRISTVDADGVALAAIQALYRLSQEKEEELRKLKQENQEQVEQLQEQQAQLQMLQAQFQRQQNQMRELQAMLAAVKTQLTRDREVQTAALASPE